MRKYQEPLVAKTGDHGFRDVLDGEDAVHARAPAARIERVDHRRSNPHRAEGGHAYAVSRVREGKRLGETERRMLGRRVDDGFRRRQQARGGEGLQKVAFPSRDHRGKHRLRGIRVRHDVDVPVALPAVEVGLAHVPAGRQDAGVRAEQIDLPVIGQNARDERGHVAFARDVAWLRYRALRRAVHAQIGHHHRARALVAEPPCKAGADTAAPARDHHHLVAISMHAPHSGDRSRGVA